MRVISIVVLTGFLVACHVLMSESQRQDDQLTRDVKNVLLEQKRLNLSRIDVSVEEGVVYLSGEASSSESKFDAARLARGVNGVRTVVNKLEVQP